MTLKHKAILAAFACSMFVSAMLMFSVQPMVGKMMLPLVGGAPSGWIVAMAFFQLALLAGYGLSHLFSFTPARLHAAILMAFCVAASFSLPIDFNAAWHETGMQISAGNVMLALCISTALPFVTLSLVTPTLQRMFSATGHVDAEDPYFLYGASNMGSFIGLLSYPFMIEPVLALDTQAHDWQQVFTVLGAMILACVAIMLFQRGDKQKAAAGEEDHKAADAPLSDAPPSWATRANWLGIAFVTTSLSVGLTMHISTDISPIPLLWVLPLGIFLLSYVLAFARHRMFRLRSLSAVHMLLVWLMMMQTFTGIGQESAPLMLILLHLVGFAVTATMCHSVLADARPRVKHLTDFYLMIAIGGALGGSFNAFVAPFLFNSMLEYPLVLAASLYFNPMMRMQVPDSLARTGRIGAGIIAAGLVAAAFLYGPVRLIAEIAILMGAVLCLLHMRSLMTGLLILAVGMALMPPSDSRLLERTRNFFGVWEVYETVSPDDGRTFRSLISSTTVHGGEFIDTDGADGGTPVPTTYYSPNSPAMDIFHRFKPHDVGVLGLGSGALACAPEAGSNVRFYEIDPAVVEIAKTYFTYLDKCPAGVIVGDGRLELDKDKDARYDLLVFDAFASDAVPFHLLTEEALHMYRAHLAPGGLLLFNISNLFLHLDGPLATTANAVGLKALYRKHIPTDEEIKQDGAYASVWMLLVPPDMDVSALTDAGWSVVEPPPGLRPWTDNYSNLLSTLF